VTPRDVKLAAAGDPFADKNAIISNMSTMFPDIKKHKKADIEHVADSVATIIAAMGKIND
jgi:Holliday junction resolvasome RuvABC endonuclease subunit